MLCSDTETNRQFEFEVKVEVTVNKGVATTPEIVHNHVHELKMHQSVADTIQIVLLQRIESQIQKTGQRGQEFDHEDGIGAGLAAEDIDFRLEWDNEQ